LETNRKQDLVEIQELFNALSKNAALDWGKHDETGLSLNQVFILEILANEGNKRPSDLAETLQITTGGITGLSQRLLEGALIQKVSDQHDRRVAHLEITEQGQRALQIALLQREKMMDRLFGTLSDEDIAYLLRIGRSLLDRTHLETGEE